MTHHLRDQIIDWLNDALSIEEGVEQVLNRQLDDAKDHPQVRKMIEEHIKETKQQGDTIRNRIQQLGGSPSRVKTTVGKVQGWLQGVSTQPAEDRLVKDLVANQAAENLEIATYTAIIEAAKLIGDNETASICEQIRQQEQATAKKIEQMLPTVVRDFMAKKQQQKAA
ncbi:MAG: DUF892 family protein [Chloroflexota bacterium]|jgi:ferritin-like metal-binding protein YciE